ncbi:MAG TPA: hypothetical protein VLZ29_09610 [Sulfurimonas sp.]|uniref:hypothetical protein n=1 Tax=Sulfurimonas sp. TaxID=2022749 RepID=UPI002B6202DE|nr:hypothetical protein [Sulfurimonas sp.]HUH43365.1 hypothetical protein [Sulfurimonas sp.]
MKTLLLICIAIILHADVKQEILHLYQNKNFEEACNVGFKNFFDNSRDEEYVSLYSLACLNIDYIDRLYISLTALKYSKEARANAAYFSTILLQKKLLYHAMIDDYDISNLILPKTDYVLSKVFDLYVKNTKGEKKEFYFFDDENDATLKYKLYVIKENSTYKVVVEEFYNSISIKKHIYW